MFDPKHQGQMCATMLEKFNKGDSLTGAELDILHDGLTFLVGFNMYSRFAPLTYYYANKLARAEMIMEARKEKK